MLPLRILYDAFIDRPKITEQKKPFEYIIPPPLNGSEQLSKLVKREAS